jgi:hypothetical protein
VFQTNSTSDPDRDLLQSPGLQPPSRCGEILSLWIPLVPSSHPISHWSGWHTDDRINWVFFLSFRFLFIILLFCSSILWSLCFILKIAPCTLSYIFTTRPSISWSREGSEDETFSHRDLRGCRASRWDQSGSQVNDKQIINKLSSKALHTWPILELAQRSGSYWQILSHGYKNCSFQLILINNANRALTNT